MLNLDTLTLKNGAHRNRDEGVCLMEAVAWFAGLPHSDHPHSPRSTPLMFVALKFRRWILAIGVRQITSVNGGVVSGNRRWTTGVTYPNRCITGAVGSGLRGWLFSPRSRATGGKFAVPPAG